MNRNETKLEISQTLKSVIDKIDENDFVKEIQANKAWGRDVSTVLKGVLKQYKRLVGIRASRKNKSSGIFVPLNVAQPLRDIISTPETASRVELSKKIHEYLKSENLLSVGKVDAKKFKTSTLGILLEKNETAPLLPTENFSPFLIQRLISPFLSK